MIFDNEIWGATGSLLPVGCGCTGGPAQCCPGNFPGLGSGLVLLPFGVREPRDPAGECVLLHLVQQNPPALRAAPFTKGGFQVLPFIKGETEGISPAVSHGCRTPTSAKQKPLAKAVHEVARQGVEPRSPYGESVLYRY